MAPYRGYAAQGPAYFWGGGGWVIWLLLLIVLAFAFAPAGTWW